MQRQRGAEQELAQQLARAAEAMVRFGVYGIWALPSPVPPVSSSSLPQDAWTGQRRALWDVADAALQGVKNDHAALEQEVSAGARRWLWGCG